MPQEGNKIHIPNSGGLEEQEKNIASQSREKKKLPREKMESIIIKLCSLHPQSLLKLSQLLDRNQDFLRKTYISPIIRNKKIKPTFEDVNHPQQAYTSFIE